MSRGIKLDDRIISIKDMKEKLKKHNALQIQIGNPDRFEK